MSDDILFDNFLITDDLQVAEEYAAISWEIKSNEERAASSAGVLTKLPFGGKGAWGADLFSAGSEDRFEK